MFVWFLRFVCVRVCISVCWVFVFGVCVFSVVCVLRTCLCVCGFVCVNVYM